MLENIPWFKGQTTCKKPWRQGKKKACPQSVNFRVRR